MSTEYQQRLPALNEGSRTVTLGYRLRLLAFCLLIFFMLCLSRDFLSHLASKSSGKKLTTCLKVQFACDASRIFFKTVLYVEILRWHLAEYSRLWRPIKRVLLWLSLCVCSQQYQGKAAGSLRSLCLGSVQNMAARHLLRILLLTWRRIRYIRQLEACRQTSN